MKDLGMFTIPLHELAGRLTDYQHAVCAYGTRDGDHRICDCKYGGAPISNKRLGSEQTGCPELRMAARIIRRLAEEEENGE